MNKGARPIITKVFPRKRLFALLDRLRKQPVIWIAGPPGSGKTTLIGSYLEVRKIPCLWYQIDAGDKDPATFFYNLSLAAGRAVPRKRKPFPLLTPEYQISTFTQRYFGEFYKRLYPPSLARGKDGRTKSFAIVFDNYQQIPAASSLHDIFVTGLADIPEGINVFLISRTAPPSPFIRLRANHLLETIGWDEIRLTLEESAGVIRLRARQKQPQEAILHFHRAADGWAAGLMLMLESVQREVLKPEALERLAPGEIVDYFGNELFNKTDTETRDFFLKTAFLPKMGAQTAAELSGLPHAGRILEALSRNNYFTEKRLRPEPLYQYHPLFRDFLLSRAQREFPPEERLRLIRQAALILEEAGEAEEAIGYLREVGDWDNLARIILQQAPLLWRQGRVRPLAGWLAGIPRDVLETRPWLLYWMGACRQPFDPVGARPFFESAFERFQEQAAVEGTFMAWSGIVASILTAFEDYKSLDRWISILETLLRDFPKFPSEEIEGIVANNMLGALAVRQPHHPAVEVWAQRVLESAERQPNIYLRMQNLTRLVIYRTYIGDTQKSLQAIHALEHLTRYPQAPPLALVAAKHAEAMHHNQAGDSYEKCLKAVSEALELAQTTGVHVLDPMILGQGVYSALRVGDRATVENLLDQMAASSHSFRPWEACFYHLLRTREGLLRGAHNQASLHAEIALKYSEQVGSPTSSVRCHLARAHVMHQLGKPRKAAEHLTQAIRISRLVKAKNLEFGAFLAKGFFALDQGEENSGLNSLRKALAIGRENDYFNTFIDRPFALVSLCLKALESEIEVPYVQELIRRCRLIPEKPPLHLASWPWPLKINTLGRFEILKDGKPLRFSRKVQEKPLQMLKVLISMGSKEAGEDLIEDILWPENEGDLSRQSFSTTLHRLRQLLGHEKAIERQEGRLTLDDRLCWVDIWAFEDLLRQAEEGLRKGSTDLAIRKMEKALEIYTGPFLSREADQSWAVSANERLRNKFLRTIETLGGCREKAGQWERALDLYQRGLEADDLAEEFYRRLMICYDRLGRRAEALAVYLRCQKILTARLRIDPAPAIQALYHSLKSSRFA